MNTGEQINQKTRVSSIFSKTCHDDQLLVHGVKEIIVIFAVLELLN